MCAVVIFVIMAKIEKRKMNEILFRHLNLRVKNQSNRVLVTHFYIIIKRGETW